jgi:acyl-CoA reductase-like NAD-dependent aldehyde dehydrogenase
MKDRPYKTSEFQNLIDGECTLGDGTELSVINPATEEAVVTIFSASAQQVDNAVLAAKAAFPAWSTLKQDERKVVLAQIAEITKANINELANLHASETGKPMADAMFEIGATASFFEFHAHVPTDALDPTDIPGSDAKAYRLPLGVVAAIVPWNFPMALMAFKVPGALLAGNTVVIKPAPTTPLTTLLWASLINEALPKGVINVIADSGDLGPILSAHKDVRKISFTGSTATGKHIMKSAADDLKRITLELGGNDPAIILEDADLDEITTPLFEAGFMNNGQTCSAVKRVYVHKSKHDALVRKLSEMADAAKIGSPLEDGVKFGPIQNQRQFEVVTELLNDAVKQGAVVEAGGYSPEGTGYYLRPTVLSGVKDGDRIVDEEQFGPVLPIISYDNIKDVITTINSSPFGLGASVWGTNKDDINTVVNQIETGSVWINKHFPVAPNIPFGGARQSGVGSELGTQGLLEFTQLKIVS